MRKLKVTLIAGTTFLAAVSGIFVPQVTQADTQWQSQIVVSTPQARLEALPIAYDSITNKYSYKFSWKMSRDAAYLFRLDGERFLSQVRRNDSVDTPYWFSPDITHTIEIYYYSNGRGRPIAEGSFRVPSVAVTNAPSSTSILSEEEEYELIANYINQAPKLPRKTTKSKADVDGVLGSFYATEYHTKLSDSKSLISTESWEMLEQTPIFLKLIDVDSTETLGQQPKGVKVKIYSGKVYASLKYRIKNNVTKKFERSELFFVKENGVWKFDLIQMLKNEL